MQQTNIDEVFKRVFEQLSQKQWKVLSARFGLKNGKRATLQAIGDELDITRERVRQIEEQGLKKVGLRLKEDYAEVLDAAHTYLASVGGVRRSDLFVQDARYQWFSNPQVKYADKKIHFFFAAAGTPRYEKENEERYGFWYTDESAKRKFFEFEKQITSFFKTSEKNSILDGKAHLVHCKYFPSCHFLSISKHFGVNVFGDVGLRAWPEIEPRTVRDKVYLALRKHGEPLHFETIAKSITKFGIDTKPAHVQTVHNELIKDSRFVLVGRGIYGLKEKGYEPGTVREVIVRLMKHRGPLSPEEVVRLVNEQRILKRNTILLALQNRRAFKKLDDGRYHVKEA